MTTSAPPDEPTAGTFERETIQAIEIARDAFARVIEQRCPGSKAVSAVSSAFGIHRKLAWQVTKVAYTDDPFVAARHMPADRAIVTWVQAAERSGVRGELIDSLRQADERFQSLIARHAEDRAEFDVLIESTRSGSDPQIEEKRRHQSFEGNRFLWGAQCRVLLALTVLLPSDDRDDHFHGAQVRGLMGYRQTRANVRWLVNQSVVIDDDSQHETTLQRVPLDPEAAARFDGVPVMPEFCSDPVPRLERSPTPDGMLQDEFLSSDVGLQGERTLVTGELLRNVAPTYATPNNKTAHFGTTVRTPAEMLHFDLFVAKGLFGRVERELRVFSDLASSYSFREADALPVSVPLVRMDSGLSMSHAPDLPGYHDLAASVFDRLNINSAAYELFRVRLPYPPMPTSVMVKHPLLAPPPVGS